MCDLNQPLSKDFKTLHTCKTEYNADSVEWCPHNPFYHILVCGNYQLKKWKGSNLRLGRILMFSAGKEQLTLLQSIDTPAVLDQKWCHNQIKNESLLGVVNAAKTLEVYRLHPELLQLELVTSYTVEDDEEETLLLSLDWSTGKYPCVEPRIACSDSRGNVHMFTFTDGQLIKEDSWHGHAFEAWITAFYYWDSNVFFSGGDDCRFLKFDRRAEGAVFCNKTHEAGVTSMHSNKNREYILSTGSYDTHVRIWDMRNMKTPLDSTKMPGPLWRLKWDPFTATYLLAACMLGGVHIVHSTLSQIADSYYQHTNIAYGADWSSLSSTRPIIASCSFYDNMLCISEVGSLQ